MGKILLKSTFQIEDRKNPEWRSRLGEPTVYIEANGSTLLLNGQPATGGILVGYIQTPVAMVIDSDSPDPRIPVAIHDQLKYFAAAWLLQQAGAAQDLVRANDYHQKFLSGIGAGPTPIAAHVVGR
jgi:hypothetical protein